MLEMVSEDPIISCVESYIGCLQQKQVDIENNKERLPKAKVRVFVNGKNLERKNISRKEITRVSLHYIFTARWWRDDYWNHNCLMQTKAFLTQLLAG